MNNNWVKIYTCTKPLQLEEIRALMLEQGITLFIFDKADTAYPWLGETELYCQPDEVIRAKQLLKEHGYE